MTDNVPTVTVEATGVSIEVSDPKTAEAALPFIEGALEYYLNDTRAKRKQHEPVAVECSKCGYEWDYRGRNPNGATCPDCQKHTTFDPRLDERGVR